MRLPRMLRLGKLMCMCFQIYFSRGQKNAANILWPTTAETPLRAQDVTWPGVERMGSSSLIVRSLEPEAPMHLVVKLFTYCSTNNIQHNLSGCCIAYI